MGFCSCPHCGKNIYIYKEAMYSMKPIAQRPWASDRDIKITIMYLQGDTVMNLARGHKICTTRVASIIRTVIRKTDRKLYEHCRAQLKQMQKYSDQLLPILMAEEIPNEEIQSN